MFPEKYENVFPETSKCFFQPFKSLSERGSEPPRKENLLLKKTIFIKKASVPPCQSYSIGYICVNL